VRITPQRNRETKKYPENRFDLGIFRHFLDNPSSPFRESAAFTANSIRILERLREEKP